jgi:hypothetical protein
MDDSLIAESMSSFNALPISSGEVSAPPVVIHYSSSEVDSEEDFVCWDGDGDDRDFSPATRETPNNLCALGQFHNFKV